MNTAVFQYYVKMSGYDDGGFGPGGQSTDDVASRIENSPEMKNVVDKSTGLFKSDKKETSPKRGIETMRMGDILDSEDF